MITVSQRNQLPWRPPCSPSRHTFIPTVDICQHVSRTSCPPGHCGSRSEGHCLLCRDMILLSILTLYAWQCRVVKNQEGPSSSRDWETLKASVSISFFFYCDQIPNRNSLREGRFIYLAHVSEGSSSWWEGAVEQSSSCHGSQEVEESSAERGKGTLEHFQGLLLQLGSDSILSWHLNNAIIQQLINLSSRSVPSRCSCFPQILSLGSQAPSTRG